MEIHFQKLLSLFLFIPLSSIEHFIEPLSNCLLADICNHTWIPECGYQGEEDFKLFIDECDMYEFNCDKTQDYQITNYSDCFRPFTGCPTLKSSLRVGDYKYILEGRKIIYEPTYRTKPIRRTTLPTTRRTTRPRGHGKRRYTPEVKKMLRQRAREALKHRTAKRISITKYMPRQLIPTNKPATKPVTIVLTKIPVIKNGTLFYKVIKGYPTNTKRYDSDFLE